MKYIEQESGYLVVIDRGEELVASLTGFVKDMELEGGSITGLGGLRDVTLAFYDLTSKEYIHKTFEGFFELAALVGNVALVHNEPFCHLHAVISGKDMMPLSGHLIKATVAVTAELSVHRGARTVRKLNDEIGLNLIEES